MAKYLFDKIKAFENHVEFYTCRHLTIGERLVAKKKFGNAHKGFEYVDGYFLRSLATDDIYSPKTLNQFIECLNLTKLKDEKGYDISDVALDGETSEISLDNLLKKFVNMVYRNESKVSKEHIAGFYDKSHEILNEALSIKELLGQDPNEMERD